MKKEFRSRLDKKRAIIKKTIFKCKEMALKDVTLLCGNPTCNLEVSLLKTINYEDNDLHHAKCVFGFLKRVEISDIEKEKKLYQDSDSKEFVEMYLDIFKEWEVNDKMKK